MSGRPDAAVAPAGGAGTCRGLPVAVSQEPFALRGPGLVA